MARRKAKAYRPKLVPRVRDLLHADRTFKLMDAGLMFKDAVALDDASAAYMIEAWEIAMTCDCDEDDGDGDVLMIVGTRE